MFKKKWTNKSMNINDSMNIDDNNFQFAKDYLCMKFKAAP